MTERPTPEQIDDIRKAVAVAFDLSHEQPSDVLAEWVVSLLAEVDALRPDLAHCEKSYVTVRTMLAESEAREKAAIARAVAAEQERDEQRQRAEEAEYGCEVLSVGDPYERLRDVREAGKTALRERDEARANLVATEQRAETAELAHDRLREAVASYLDDEDDDRVQTMDALIAARRAPPTDLAEALRRELRAEGAELVSSKLVDHYRKRAAQFGHVEEGVLFADLMGDIDTLAAELRGPK